MYLIQNVVCLFTFVVVLCLTLVSQSVGGTYLDSAHGDAVEGVERRVLAGEYAQGNCVHCHALHGTIEGQAPSPVAGAPFSRVLFALNYNSSSLVNPYFEDDNICFYCHSDYTEGQQVENLDYSVTFGGGSIIEGPQSILAAFNEASYHNLRDINDFLANDTNFQTWYAKRGNPCIACHDPHLAKNNNNNLLSGFPLLSAISKPGVDPPVLWGESETMSSSYPTEHYEAPFASSTATREPADTASPTDGSKTPDYAGFCSTCHNENTAISSTNNLNRDLVKVNWTDSGLLQNKHGELGRDGSNSFREPYATAAASYNNFILSCTDCHEAHGSENVVLLRRRINGEDLEGVVTESVTETMAYVCKRCHLDDFAAGQSASDDNTWEYVHHLVPDAPYVQANCTDCHAGAGGDHIDCSNCHNHGMDDSWLPVQALRTGRITF